MAMPKVDDYARGTTLPKGDHLQQLVRALHYLDDRDGNAQGSFSTKIAAAWPAVITNEGPNGEADWIDSRYWIKRQYVDGATSSNAQIVLKDDIQQKAGSGSGSTQPYVFTATNASELNPIGTDTHNLATDGSQAVIVFTFPDKSSTGIKARYLFVGPPPSPSVLVLLLGTEDGFGTYAAKIIRDAAGDPIDPASPALSSAILGYTPDSTSLSDSDAVVWNVSEANLFVDPSIGGGALSRSHILWNSSMGTAWPKVWGDGVIFIGRLNNQKTTDGRSVVIINEEQGQICTVRLFSGPGLGIGIGVYDARILNGQVNTAVGITENPQDAYQVSGYTTGEGSLALVVNLHELEFPNRGLVGDGGLLANGFSYARDFVGMRVGQCWREAIDFQGPGIGGHSLYRCQIVYIRERPLPRCPGMVDLTPPVTLGDAATQLTEIRSKYNDLVGLFADAGYLLPCDGSTIGSGSGSSGSGSSGSGSGSGSGSSGSGSSGSGSSGSGSSGSGSSGSGSSGSGSSGSGSSGSGSSGSGSGSSGSGSSGSGSSGSGSSGSGSSGSGSSGSGGSGSGGSGSDSGSSDSGSGSSESGSGALAYQLDPCEGQGDLSTIYVDTGAGLTIGSVVFGGSTGSAGACYTVSGIVDAAGHIVDTFDGSIRGAASCTDCLAPTCPYSDGSGFATIHATWHWKAVRTDGSGIPAGPFSDGFTYEEDQDDSSLPGGGIGGSVSACSWSSSSATPDYTHCSVLFVTLDGITSKWRYEFNSLPANGASKGGADEVGPYPSATFASGLYTITVTNFRVTH